MDAPVYVFERTEKQEGPAGTFIPMPPTAANPDGVTYHFKHDPDRDGTDEFGEPTRRFFAEVTDVAHMTMFLAASNAFRLIEAEESQDPGATDPGAGAGDGGGAVTGPADLEALDLGDLRKVFKTELGRTPSPNSKAETLIAQIKAKRAETAAE